MRISGFSVAAIALFAAGAAHAQVVPAVNNIVGHQTGSGDFSLGWEFTVNSPISVTELGAFDHNGDGLTQSHPVGIFRVSDGALLASATVGTSDPLDSSFRYVGISPLSLVAGESYRVTAVFFNGGDNYSYGSISFSTASELSFVGERYNSGNTLANPTLSGGGGINGYFSANFKFTSGAAAPEPGSLALLALGGVLGVVKRRRRLA